MSTRARRVLAAASLWMATTGCVTCTWRDRALVERNDLSTPALAFESFRAAIRCDDSMAGYRVISEEMKERLGITSAQFVIGWDALFKARPAARLMGNADIVNLAGDARRATVTASAYGHELTIAFVRQDFYAVNVEGEPLIDGYVPSIEAELFHQDEKLLARARDARLTGAELSSIRSFSLATEWKISDFVQTPPPQP